MKAFFSKIWNGWKIFARTLGRIQTEIILFLFYFLIFTPFGLMLKIFRYDSLRLRLRKKSTWQDVSIGKFDWKKASRQS